MTQMGDVMKIVWSSDTNAFLNKTHGDLTNWEKSLIHISFFISLVFFLNDFFGFYNFTKKESTNDREKRWTITLK
jgi:hypothetical protein